MGENFEDIIIVGSGPAGYTAALYAARANRNPLVIEGYAWGGLLQETTDVENYPGFPAGIGGPQLMAAMREQAERFGARMETDEVTKLELSSGGAMHKVWVGNECFVSHTVILAMGAKHRKLGVPGEELLSGRGVSFCALCDSNFFRGLPTLVVGGGDSAMEEALILAKFSPSVVIAHRREDFRASATMLAKVKAHPSIKLLTPYQVEEFVAGSSGVLETVTLRNVTDGLPLELGVRGAFIAIGHNPQSHLVADQVTVDEAGYVLTDGFSTATNLPGVFAAGDLVDRTYRQAITAAASGCRAALDAEAYLNQ